MNIQPHDQPTREEADNLHTVLVDRLAEQVKHEAQQALRGRAQRFQRVAAEFGHLGAVTEELLTLALLDVERTPDYFASLTRLGLTQALQEDVSPPSEVIEGTATKKETPEVSSDERQ